MTDILILEDEEKSREALAAILRQLEGQVSGGLRTAKVATLEEARTLLKGDEMFALFLLDINLDCRNEQDASGLIFAEEIREMVQYELTPIVMLTSVASLEMDAYRKIHCYQYILKPYDAEEVKRVVSRLLAHARPAEKPSVIVKKNGINYKIPCEEIVFCQAIPRGIRLCLKNEQMDIPYLTIRQFLNQLPKADFFQCHRMFVVNKNHVKYYDLVNRMIQVEGYREAIDIGVTYKSEIRRLLHE